MHFRNAVCPDQEDRMSRLAFILANSTSPVAVGLDFACSTRASGLW
jgi:hypothetical protein